jgi:acyl dehydratase
MSVRFEDIAIGDAIPELVKGPISRTQLALFAGASGDHNPIHLDDAEARAGGLPGVIVHGMLSMAFLGQMLTNWVPSAAVRSFSARFTATAVPGDTLTCRGVVKAKTNGLADGQKLVELEISAVNQRGEQTLAGTATVALP